MGWDATAHVRLKLLQDIIWQRSTFSLPVSNKGVEMVLEDTVAGCELRAASLVGRAWILDWQHGRQTIMLEDQQAGTSCCRGKKPSNDKRLQGTKRQHSLPRPEMFDAWVLGDFCRHRCTRHLIVGQSLNVMTTGGVNLRHQHVQLFMQILESTFITAIASVN